MGWINWLWRYDILDNSFILKIIFILVFGVISSANENWIPIAPTDNKQAQKVKPKTQLDVNLSQIEPVNKMMKKATVIKQIIDATNKKEKATTNDKNWFVLKSEASKW